MRDVDYESANDHPERENGKREHGVDAIADLAAIASTDAADLPLAAFTLRRRCADHGVMAVAGWYVRYLGQQASALGSATVELGRALVARNDALDAAGASLAEDLAALRGRVDALGRR